MIDDILALEHVQRGPTSVAARASVEIGVVIDKAIAREREALERARCTVTVFREPGLDRAYGPWDSAYLLRVFGNLLRNAANHAAGTPIHITLARRRARLGIVFADRGPGLVQPDLGTMGKRDIDAASESPIHGIGLWIVRRAIDRLGGRLQVQNRAGGGLAFDFELPGLERRTVSRSALACV